MLQKLMVFALALILSLATPGRVAYAQARSKDAAYTAMVKTEIAKRGTGKRARVAIKLHNGQELKGRIEQSNDSTFTLRDEKTGKSTSVAYSEVKSVGGLGLSKGKKIGIIAALTMGVAGVVIIVGILDFKKNFNPFENGVRR